MAHHDTASEPLPQTRAELEALHTVTRKRRNKAAPTAARSTRRPST